VNNKLFVYNVLLKNFFFFYLRVKILDRESIGIATIIKRIIAGYTPSDFSKFSPPLVNSFLENSTLLTCQFAEGAAIEENVNYIFFFLIL